MTDPPEHYSLAETARLFRTSRSKIKGRCASGDFDYEVDGRGYYHITRESILRHLPELEMKHSG
jgi:hypothetical protein